MRVRVRWRKSARSRSEGLLRWASAAFFLLGLVMIGFSAAAYFTRSHQQRLFRFAASEGSVVGRVEIPRIGVSVMVVEGVKARDLKIAVGHIPGTAFPGEAGNVGIAGHRDTFFRKLREVRPTDAITPTTLYGVALPFRGKSRIDFDAVVALSLGCK